MNKNNNSNSNRSNIITCLILGLFITYLVLSILQLLVASYKRKVIDPLSSVNPDGNMLLLRVGPENSQRGFTRPEPTECKAVLLELEGTSLKRHQLLQIEGGLWFKMAWNPVSTDELYFATICNGGWTASPSISPDGSFMKMKSTIEGHSLTEIHSLSNYPNLSSAFSWSPDGTVIVGLATEFPHQILKDKLAFSFDGGKNVELTDITIYDRIPAWIDNNELADSTPKCN